MDCEEPIAEARLKALPYATLCIQCAEQAEAVFVVVKSSWLSDEQPVATSIEAK